MSEFRIEILTSGMADPENCARPRVSMPSAPYGGGHNHRDNINVVVVDVDTILGTTRFVGMHCFPPTTAKND